MKLTAAAVTLGAVAAACGCAGQPPATTAPPTSAPPPGHAPSEHPAHAPSEHPAHGHAEPHPPSPRGEGTQHGHHAATANHRFEDPERWAKVFDDPKRDAWQRPESVLDFLKLDASARVADLGAGTGYFSVRLAKRVPQGKVYAVDIEPKLLEHLAQRAKQAGLANVVTVLASPDDAKLPSDLDLVLVVDTYHHISERVPYFEAVAKRLKPTGRLVIVDFRLGDLPVGPPDEHKISQDQAHTELEAAGFQLCGELKSLPYQYVLSFGTTC
ncbi:MAG: class I SAM-dependent methyltransferase [Polyangiaceae bacterium]